MRRSLYVVAGLALGLLLFACPGPHPAPEAPREPRRGDEIAIAGRFFHTGTPVVLFSDPRGYDAYRGARAGAGRYSLRSDTLSPAEADQVRRSGWSLDRLAQVIDQFVIHYDQASTSRGCFATLGQRGLSVHFLLDLDGTIYQTLDVQERAYHATIANNRSVGIEIANIGAYPVPAASRSSSTSGSPATPAGLPAPFDRWYRLESGRPRISLPREAGDGGLRQPGLPLYPARPQFVTGNIQGQMLRQLDFTPQQYEALARLTATLCRALPRLRCDYPRDSSGVLIPRKLTPAQFAAYQGLLGHYHVQSDKLDPGPAFAWNWVIDRARELGRAQQLASNE